MTHDTEYKIVEVEGGFEVRSRPIVTWTTRGTFPLRSDAVSFLNSLNPPEKVAEPEVPDKSKDEPKSTAKWWSMAEEAVLDRYRDSESYPYDEIRMELQKVRPLGPHRSNSAIDARYGRMREKDLKRSTALGDGDDGDKEVDATKAELQHQRCQVCGYKWQGTSPCPNESAHRHVLTAPTAASPERKPEDGEATSEVAPPFIRPLTAAELMSGRGRF